MSRYLVHGGVPLRGTVDAAANKNAVLPIMAATLLTDDECVLTNVPQITDVVVMGNLLRELGARVDGLGSKELRICCADVRETELNPNLVRKLACVRDPGRAVAGAPRPCTHPPSRWLCDWAA